MHKNINWSVIYNNTNSNSIRKGYVNGGMSVPREHLSDGRWGVTWDFPSFLYCSQILPVLPVIPAPVLALECFRIPPVSSPTAVFPSHTQPNRTTHTKQWEPTLPRPCTSTLCPFLSIPAHS